MDESFWFDDSVGSDAYEHPSYPLLDDEESTALFEAFTNAAWEGLRTESGLSSGMGVQGAPSTSLGEQTSEATSDLSSSPSTRPHFSASSSSISSVSSASERVPKPVSTKGMTGARKCSSPTPPTPVIPTPSGVPAQSPVLGIASIPPSTLSVDFAEAPIAFASMASGTVQMPQNTGYGRILCPPGIAYASQSFSGRTMQGPTYTPSGAIQAPALQPYCAGTMPSPFYPWNVMATAPIAEPYSSQKRSAPVNPGNNITAPSWAMRYPTEMAPPPAPAMNPPPIPAPSKKRAWEFVDPVMPKGFVANPDNHGRFQRINGKMVYLNGPKAKKLRSGGE